MNKDAKEKICFVIAPIGADASVERVRSDQVLKHIIEPSARDCGYEPIRADKISEPGLITSQVIQHIVDDPLVIADLTGRNPNVFYELALRHAIKKPVVLIIHATETIPFDVAGSRTVHVDHHDLDSVAKAREEIVRQIRAGEKNPSDVDNPISVALDLQSLRKSDNPLEKSNAEIIMMLQEIKTSLTEVSDGPRRPRIDPRMLEEMMMNYDRVSRALDFDDEKPLTKEQIEVVRHGLHRFGRVMEHMCMEFGMPPELFMRRMRRGGGKTETP